MFLKLIKKLKIKIKRKKVERFENYMDAEKKCLLNAYQNKELCDVVAKKTLKKIESLKKDGFKANSSSIFLPAAVCKILYETGKKKLNIVDFGGACGLHFFETKTFFKDFLNVDWIVVETAQMIKSAKEAGIKNDGLFFESDFSNTGKRSDLLFSSGVLQYVENPYELLCEMIKLEPLYILLNRMSLNEKDYEIVTVQKSRLSENGPGELPEGYADKIVKYPQTNISINKFLNIIQSDYNVEWEFDDDSGVHKIPEENIIGKGYLFKRRS